MKRYVIIVWLSLIGVRAANGFPPEYTTPARTPPRGRSHPASGNPAHCSRAPARAAAVVDHHLLPELLGELLGEHARENIARAARRRGNHQPDGPGGIILREDAFGADADKRKPRYDYVSFHWNSSCTNRSACRCTGMQITGSDNS